MASQINPNLIDGAYPVAGQDNNSQGFRDNFTNTKTNFSAAEAEINDLQTNVVLKSALTGTVLDNNMGGSLLYDATIQDFGATRVALGSVSGSNTINYASGHYQTLSTAGSVTLAFSNFPTSGTQAWVIVRVTVTSTAYTLTLPAAVGTSASAASVLGIQGISSNVITFKETGTYEFQFHTEDGGTTVYLSELTRPRNRFTNPLFLTGSEDLAASAAASLSLTTSYFTTAAAETATLAAGAEGQIKVFSAVAIASGNMVITVTNAGWKASGTGTLTFATIGAGCTLQYTNSKWFCIGNNGCTFA
jgi:hypothetical protein